ncbi:DNA ligase 1-like isoform X2 [Narcine bancroftii]|uniref:DNA ligase 1-like isoform X2 n=1 Tax=Narcine bancroftii TaxID=1343680 RepID=UPI003831BEB8
MVSPDSETTELCSPLAKQKVCFESPTPGALQQHLFYGEYDPFKYAPIFESDFIQVTKKGEVLNIHNQVIVVTVGVTSTSPNFSLPNVMLLARPINVLREMMCNCQVTVDRCPMELTRLFPLSFVNISIHDVYNRRLRLKLANGRTFYLQLYVHPECENRVFERWMKLVTLLHANPEEVYGYEAVTPEIECILEQGSVETSVTELSEWQLEPPEMSPSMRQYYEASHASSKKSERSEKSKSEKTEDCSERSQSRRSKKSGSSKMRDSEEETESIRDLSQEQEPWPPVEMPQKKTRGPIGFNFFKGDKGSKEKALKEGHKARPASAPLPVNEEKPKLEEDREGKGDREEGKGRQEKSKGKGDKAEKERKRKDREKEREKLQKQKEKERQLKEKQQEKDDRKQKGREEKGKVKEKRQQEKEERQRKREARQREKEEKKQREREDRKQRGMEDKKVKEKKKQ